MHSVRNRCGLPPAGGEYNGGTDYDISCVCCELTTERCKSPEAAVARWNQIVERGYTPEDVEQIALYNKLMKENRNATP